MSWTFSFSILLFSNADCILIPNDGMADSFLANNSLYFGFIVHSKAGLDGQDLHTRCDFSSSKVQRESSELRTTPFDVFKDKCANAFILRPPKDLILSRISA